MTFTSDERCEVAKELRELAATGCIRYAEEFYEELREIVAFNRDGSFDGVADSLADLIDCPTCKTIIRRELHTAFGKPITGLNAYILSCGHQAIGFEKPEHCPKCGAVIVDED